MNPSLPPIRYRISYFDTIGVWFQKRDRSLKRDLLPLCRDVCPQRTKLGRPKPPVTVGRGRRRRTYRHALHLHGPSRAALELLHDYARARHVLVNEVHVALDFLTPGPADARGLSDVLADSLYLRTGVEIRNKGGTRYWSRGNWGTRCAVVYADSRAAKKHGGIPACHLEVRFKGKSVAAANLARVHDLLNLDEDAFWRQYLRLEQPKLLLIVRQLIGCPTAKRTKPNEHERKLMAALRRIAAGQEGALQTQNLRAYLRDAPGFKPGTAMERLTELEDALFGVESLQKADLRPQPCAAHRISPVHPPSLACCNRAGVGSPQAPHRPNAGQRETGPTQTRR